MTRNGHVHLTIFDPVDYWKKFDHLYVIGKKMILEEEDKENCGDLMKQVKADLTEELYAMEEKRPGSISLSAGSCEICGENGCTKTTGEPCRFPDKMRYSIEVLRR